MFNWKKVGDEYHTKVRYCGRTIIVKLRMHYWCGWEPHFDTDDGPALVPWTEEDQFKTFSRIHTKQAKAAAAKGMMKLGMVAA